MSISKVFHGADVDTHALRDVSFRVQSGDFVSIEGPSGSGKSTLLSLLGLLDNPSNGEYFLKGIATTTLGHRERAQLRAKEVGLIFQDFQLIGDLSVAENIELPLTYRSLSKRERKRRLVDVLDRVEMTHRANHFPSQLSGGQQQRVAVARALSGEPSLLLADEPTGNLDSHNGELVMQLLKSLNEAGSTVILVTHDPRYRDFANKILKLHDGAAFTEHTDR